jgi:hypothetical protein
MEALDSSSSSSDEDRGESTELDRGRNIVSKGNSKGTTRAADVELSSSENEEEDNDEELDHKNPRLINSQKVFEIKNETFTIISPRISPRTKELNDRYKSITNMMSNWKDLGDMDSSDGEEKIDIPKETERKGTADFPRDERSATEAEVNLGEISLDFWKNLSIPRPPSPPTAPLLQSDKALNDTSDQVPMDGISDYAGTFDKESQNVSLVVSKLPEAIVLEQRKKMDKVAHLEREKAIQLMKKREADILWRENCARERILQNELESKQRVQNELKKLNIESNEREEFLNRQFRRAKEDLEAHLAKKQAQLDEIHGSLSVGNEVCIFCNYYVYIDIHVTLYI